MRQALSILLLLFSIPIYGQNLERDPVWVAIPGHISTTSKAYVDRNSLKIEDASINARSGTMLIVLNEIKESEMGGQIIRVKSMLRKAVAACNSEVVSYAFDLFYGIDFPKNDTPILYMIQYKPSVQNIFPMPKSTLMHQTLCLDYI